MSSVALEGRVAWVTGGTKGVGLGVVEGLLESGATVYYTGRSAAPAWVRPSALHATTPMMPR